MGDYCIKDGYQHRTENATVEEQPGDYWAGVRHLLSNHAQYAAYETAAQLIQQKQLKTTLDVGCGLGHKAMRLLHPITDLTCVEQATVVQVASEAFPQGKFVAANLEQPDETGLGTYDLVLSVDVIEHLLDPDLLMNFVKAHCHDQSYIVISTPERDVRRGKDNMQSPKSEHVREWNMVEFAAYMQTHGLSIVEHRCVPAFRVGTSWYMIKERLRLLRKGISLNYSQVIICHKQ